MWRYNCGLQIRFNLKQKCRISKKHVNCSLNIKNIKSLQLYFQFAIKKKDLLESLAATYWQQFYRKLLTSMLAKCFAQDLIKKRQ